MTDQYFEHQELIKRTDLLITQEFPKNFRSFDRPVGKFYAKRFDGELLKYIPLSIGRKGQCDKWGVYKLYFRGINIPIHIEMEFKTGQAVLNKDQIIWRDFCYSMGWWWFEVRNETQFIQELKLRIIELHDQLKGNKI